MSLPRNLNQAAEAEQTEINHYATAGPKKFLLKKKNKGKKKRKGNIEKGKGIWDDRDEYVMNIL